MTQQALQSIASTIQRVEGYYPGSIAYQNNNPGNLVYVGQPGATRDRRGYAVFPSYNAGYQALLSQIENYASRGLTIRDTMRIYAPPDDGKNPLLRGNNPDLYAREIASNLGVDINTPLSTLGTQEGPDATSGPSHPSYEASLLEALPTDVDYTLIGLGLIGLAVLFAFRD